MAATVPVAALSLAAPWDHIMPAPLEDPTRTPCGDLLDSQQAQVGLDSPATVRSGATLHHGLLVRNLSGRVLPVATNGKVTAVVVDPKAGQVIGGFAEAQHMPLIMFCVAPGAAKLRGRAVDH